MKQGALEGVESLGAWGSGCRALGGCRLGLRGLGFRGLGV